MRELTVEEKVETKRDRDDHEKMVRQRVERDRREIIKDYFENVRKGEIFPWGRSASRE